MLSMLLVRTTFSRPFHVCYSKRIEINRSKASILSLPPKESQADERTNTVFHRWRKTFRVDNRVSTSNILTESTKTKRIVNCHRYNAIATVVRVDNRVSAFNLLAGVYWSCRVEARTTYYRNGVELLGEGFQFIHSFIHSLFILTFYASCAGANRDVIEGQDVILYSLCMAGW
jgi:hypothetical protein